MMFEKNGMELSKDSMINVSTDAVNNFLATLGLEFKIRLDERNLLTSPKEVEKYFLEKRGPDPKQKRLSRLFHGVKANIPEEVRRIPGTARRLAPFCYADDAIFTPLKESREEQLNYWRELIEDFVMYTITDCYEGSTQDSEKFYYDTFGVEERIGLPQREHKIGSYLLEGKDLPIDAFTLKEIVNEGWHFAFRNQKGYGIGMDGVLEQTICFFSKIYDRYKSLPTILSNLTVFDFPDEWIDGYQKIMLLVPLIPHSETDKKATYLIESIRKQVCGSLKDGLALVRESLARGIRTYSEMQSYLDKLPISASFNKTG